MNELSHLIKLTKHNSAAVEEVLKRILRVRSDIPSQIPSLTPHIMTTYLCPYEQKTNLTKHTLTAAKEVHFVIVIDDYRGLTVETSV